jgi:tetratricopeptide (TPR) repeat protein
VRFGRRPPRVVVRGSHVGRDLNVVLGSAAPVRPPAQLPTRPANVVGRSSEATALRDALLAGCGRAAVVGSPGTGKTTLAVEVAHDVADAYPDGVLFAHLASATGVEDVLRSFATALAPRESLADELTALTAAYRSATAGRRVLVVLDDAVNAEWLEHLVPTGVRCGLLLTCRNTAVSLDGVTSVRIDAMAPAEARQILTGGTGSGHGEELDGIDEVVRLCDGLPLALSVAAAVYRAHQGWTFRDLATHLSTERLRLERLRAGDIAFRATLDLSFRHLGDDAARVLGAAATLPGVLVTTFLVAEVLGVDLEWTRTALARLVDWAMTIPLDPDVYALHDLTRLYAAEHFAGEAGDAGVRTLHESAVRWYREEFEAICGVLSGKAGDEPVPTDTLHQVLNGADLYSANVTQILSKGVELGRHEDVLYLAICAADIATRRGKRERAVVYSECAVAAARRLENPIHELHALVDLAARLGYIDTAKAIEVEERALGLARQLGEPGAEASLLGNLAVDRHAQGDHEAALGLHEQALSLYQSVGDHDGVLRCMVNIANVYRATERPDRAAACLADAYAAITEKTDPHVAGGVLGNYAVVLLERGETGEARRLLVESLALLRRSGDIPAEMTAQTQLAQLALHEGRTADARDHCRAAFDLARRTGDPVPATETLLVLMDVVAESDEAASVARLACDVVDEWSDHPAVALHVGDGLFELATARADVGLAHRAMIAITTALVPDDPPAAAYVMLSRAALYLRTGSTELASDLIEAADRTVADLDDEDARRRCAVAAAFVRDAEGDPAAADDLRRLESEWTSDPDEFWAFVRDPWLDRMSGTAAAPRPQGPRPSRRERRRAERVARKRRSSPSIDVDAALSAQLDAFRRAFGRDPAPTDPLFFDPNAAEPIPLSTIELEEAMGDAMTASGADPAYVYAYRVTELLVTEQNWELLSPDDRAEWQRAIRTYGAAVELGVTPGRSQQELVRTCLAVVVDALRTGDTDPLEVFERHLLADDEYLVGLVMTTLLYFLVSAKERWPHDERERAVTHAVEVARRDDSVARAIRAAAGFVGVGGQHRTVADTMTESGDDFPTAVWLLVAGLVDTALTGTRALPTARDALDDIGWPEWPPDVDR